MKIILSENLKIIEAKKKKQKGVTYEGEHYSVNPWAICHTTVDKEKNPKKYEKCVRKVKKENKTK